MQSEIALLASGLEIRSQLSGLLAAAEHSVCIIMYIFVDDASGRSVVAELAAAARRGVRVRLVIDGFGSGGASDRLFAPLRQAGGQVARFNTRWHPRYLFRNHQKLILADGRSALLGGFNIGDDYFGDGVKSGWREVGVRADGPAVQDLQVYFDRLWEALEGSHVTLRALSEAIVRHDSGGNDLEWIVSGPGLQMGRYGRLLRRDLRRASRLSLLMAYFVPTASLRRMIGRIAHRGRVELILPQATDIPLSRLASWSTFRRLLRDGCEIYEYQPRPLHAKVIVLDDVVYVGSMNLDTRSLHLNFELVLRVRDARLAGQARELIERDIALSRRITQDVYDQETGYTQRVARRLAYSLVSKLDYFLTRKFLD